MVAYEIFAIRYATVDHSARDNFLIRDIHDGPMPMDYYVWLLRNGDRTVLVDTGFDRPAAEARGRTLLQHPVDALQAIGIAAQAIQDVIITHLHYDHAGNLSAFPNATFHLQDAEMAYATGRCMCHGVLRRPFEVEDVVTMVRRVYDGRVRFHEGDATLFPGVSVHLVPGHTRGLQAVRVETARGGVVLASDASHFYANMERRNPFPIVVDVAQMMESWGRLLALAETPDHVVPGHDPLVRALYPKLASDRLEASLLHLPPRPRTDIGGQAKLRDATIPASTS
jgi:glyoxylase-like metal-dependent hydrolase (beta-lactamase superfamily II)